MEIPNFKSSTTGMKKALFFSLIIWISAGYVFAQPANDDCSSAGNLCAGLSFSGSNQNAGLEGTEPSGISCFGLNNPVWFTFNTNASGGNATITISNISCLTGAGMGNGLEAVVVSAGGSCNFAGFTEVSNCASGTSSITLSASGLTPSTLYYVLVDGDSTGVGVTQPAQCDFQIQVDGPAVLIENIISTTDQNCGALDGEIQITSSTGGTTPYQYSINGGAFQSSGTFSGLSAGTYIITVEDGSTCVQNTDTVVINQLNGPQNATAATTDASCTGNDGTLTVNGVSGGNPAYSYSLNGGAPQASNSFTNLGAGSYTVLVTDQQGCTTTVSAFVANNGSISDAIPVIVNADCNSTNGSIVVNANGGTAPLTYALNGGASQASNTFGGLSLGIYSVVITDNNGCTFSLTAIPVMENPRDLVPEITISSSPNPACVGDNITTTAVISNGGTNPQITFFVNGVSVQSGSGQTFSSAGLNPGDIVTAELISDDPCAAVSTVSSNSSSLTINPISNPTVTLSSSTTTACANEIVTLTATQNGCTATATYQWLVNGTPVASDTTGVFSSTFGGNASVSVNMSCSDPCATPATSNTVDLSITVVNANAGPDQVISPGQTAILNGSGGGAYSWVPTSSLSDNNTATTFATPGATTVYTLTVTVNGCTDQDNVTVFVVEPINVPNTFTPNGDGTNDIWEIRNIEDFPNAKVTVYDRWGQKVFNTVGYTNANAWDGTNHGLNLPAAVYYYVIDLNNGGGKDDVYSGSITIVH